MKWKIAFIFLLVLLTGCAVPCKTWRVKVVERDLNGETLEWKCLDLN